MHDFVEHQMVSTDESPVGIHLVELVHNLTGQLALWTESSESKMAASMQHLSSKKAKLLLLEFIVCFLICYCITSALCICLNLKLIIYNCFTYWNFDENGEK